MFVFIFFFLFEFVSLFLLDSNYLTLTLLRIYRQRFAEKELEKDELQDLENRMDEIMRQLRGIESEVDKLKRRQNNSPEKLTLVIDADPSYPPRSLISLAQSMMVLGQDIRINMTEHKHSSLLTGCPADLTNWLRHHNSNHNRVDNHLNLTWIWKNVGVHPVAKPVNWSKGDLCGETTIARLFARLLESWTGCALYENLDLHTTAHIDEWLDAWELCNKSGLSGLIKLVEARLAIASWLAGPLPGQKSLADIFLSAVLSDKLKSVRAKQWISQSSLV